MLRPLRDRHPSGRLRCVVPRGAVSGQPCGWLCGRRRLRGSYLVGSIPCGVHHRRAVTGEDVTEHGTGNVGAMNVRRTTARGAGSPWPWSPTPQGRATRRSWRSGWSRSHRAGTRSACGGTLELPVHLCRSLLVPMAAVAGAVLGHNYSCWMAIIKRRFARTGKGLATGAGALLVYDWRYFVAVRGRRACCHRHHALHDGRSGRCRHPARDRTAARLARLAVRAAHGRSCYAAHHKRFVGHARRARSRSSTSTTAGSARLTRDASATQRGRTYCPALRACGQSCELVHARWRRSGTHPRRYRTRCSRPDEPGPRCPRDRAAARGTRRRRCRRRCTDPNRQPAPHGVILST